MNVTYLGEQGLQSIRIVRDTVADCAFISCADEVGPTVMLVLRMSLANYPPRGIEEGRRLERGINVTLFKRAFSLSPIVNVALGPRIDNLRSLIRRGSRENSGSLED